MRNPTYVSDPINERTCSGKCTKHVDVGAQFKEGRTGECGAGPLEQMRWEDQGGFVLEDQLLLPESHVGGCRGGSRRKQLLAQQNESTGLGLPSLCCTYKCGARWQNSCLRGFSSKAPAFCGQSHA